MYNIMYIYIRKFSNCSDSQSMVQNVSQYISVLGLLYDTSSICTNLKQTPSLQLSLRPVASVAWKETPTAVAQKRLLSTGLATNKPRVAVAWLVSLCASLSYRTKTLQTAPSWWCKKGQHSLIWWGFSYSIYSIMGIPMNQPLINHQPSTNHQTTRHNPLDASFPDGLCVSIFRHELWLFVDPLIEEYLPVGCDM